MSPEHENLWLDNSFSSLIINYASQLPTGLSPKLFYPAKGNTDATNIANIPVGDTTLAFKMLEAVESPFKHKIANWVLLIRTLLDNSVCYLENSSADGRFKEKEIATRSLFLANNLSDSPIPRFDILYAMIAGDYNTLSQLPPNIQSPFIAYAQALQAGLGTPKKQLDAVAACFKTDIGVLKAYIKAYRALNTPLSSCESGQLFYLKLKPGKLAGRYNISTSMRNVPTEYKVTSDYILQPLSLMRAQYAQLNKLQSENVLAISFMRANNVQRDILVTTNKRVLSQIFSKPENLEFQSSYTENRGFMSVIDLCGSEMSGNPQRLVTLPRIISLQVIKPDGENLVSQLAPYGFDSSNAGTDFNMVITTFKGFLDRYSTNVKLLTNIYNQLQVDKNQCQEFANAQQALIAINTYVDTHNTYTTSYARTLHLFMLRNPLFFPGYTGRPEKIEGISLNTRHQSLGVIE